MAVQLQRPYAITTREPLKVSRNQLRIVAGLLTMHSHLKGRIFKLVLIVLVATDAIWHLKQPYAFFVTVIIHIQASGPAFLETS